MARTVDLIGFDNARPVRESRGPGGRGRGTLDHKGRMGTVRPYRFKDAAALLEDFWAEVDKLLREKGVIQRGRSRISLTLAFVKTGTRRDRSRMTGRVLQDSQKLWCDLLAARHGRVDRGSKLPVAHSN